MADLNLAFEVIALQNARYRIMVRSPDAEWMVECPSSFSQEDQREITQTHHHRDIHANSQENSEYIQHIGQRLYEFLIASHPRTEKYFCESLENPRVRIRLLLQTERAGWLNVIPWEWLCTASLGFLALSPKTPVVRSLHDMSPRPPAPVIAPLKILTVIAAPPNYPYVNVEQEWDQLQEILSPLRTAGLLNIQRLERATWSAVKRQLRAEDYQVLHFIGFSQVDGLTGQAFLALEDDSYASASHRVSSIDLGRELGPESTIRLVCLNIRDPIAGASAQIAEQLLKSGLTSVITTQFGISPASEQLFAQHFYPPLCESHPVDAALNVARRALAEYGPNDTWAAPALYLRARDGMLFRPVVSVSER